MLFRFATLALVATLAVAGNIVYPGPAAQPQWRTGRPTNMASTPRPVQLAARFAMASKMVYPGPTSPPVLHSFANYQRTSTLRPTAAFTSLGNNPAPLRAQPCELLPPEGVTEDTLDLRCFEVTSEEDFISTFSLLEQQCARGFVLSNEKCMRVVPRVRRTSPSKVTGKVWGK